jgi:hypothetical protein
VKIVIGARDHTDDHNNFGVYTRSAWFLNPLRAGIFFFLAMSIRLSSSDAIRRDVHDHSSASSSSSGEDDETWEDWVSDSAESRPCHSLFDDATFPSVKESLAYDATKHAFDLDRVCSRLGQCIALIDFKGCIMEYSLYLALDFHQRIRFINYIRKEARNLVHVYLLFLTDII